VTEVIGVIGHAQPSVDFRPGDPVVIEIAETFVRDFLGQLVTRQRGAGNVLRLLLFGQMIARVPAQGVIRNREFFCDRLD
jgi:methyl coenzyme M reductase gamma subunit